MAVRATRTWLMAAGLAGVLALVAAVRLAAPPSTDPPPLLVGQEPAAAAAFLAAYARGDEASAEELASPLYRVEGARRGISPAERAALRSASGVLAFRYVGGVRVDGGFAQLLYAARATAPDGRPALSAWRADADPAGRLVWLELVWLFSDAVGAVVPVGTVENTRDLPLSLGRRIVLIGLRSEDGCEGYYGLGLPAVDGPPAPMGFVAVDADGELRPGAWSYGQPAALVEYGTRRPRVATDLPADLAALRGAYLRTLP